MTSIWELNQKQIGQRTLIIDARLSNLELVQIFISLSHEIHIFNRLERGDRLSILSGKEILKDNEQTYLEIAENAKYCYEKSIKVLKLRNSRINSQRLTEEDFQTMMTEEICSFVNWEVEACKEFIELNCRKTT
jgi:hypothetical protein